LLIIYTFHEIFNNFVTSAKKPKAALNVGHLNLLIQEDLFMNEYLKITTVQQLVEELDDIEDHEKYGNIAKRIDIEQADFALFESWKADTYSRNCIRRTVDYELLLLCWEAGQETPIHCHNEQECWVYVVEGELVEQRFDHELKKIDVTGIESTSLIQKEKSYMNDYLGYHSLANNSNQRAISLHLYAKPIERCRVYDKEEKCFNWVELEYHTSHMVH